uniref:F-box domain-containing protein n=1 Tax=Arundo donax TaxID=35708 RepID=A0A0A9D3Y3_ARUDO
MAPLTRQRKKALAAAAGVAVPLIGTGGRLSALPDDVLRRILGFLPAQDAVRTCVLGWQWRDLWKSASGLRIWCDGEGEKSVEDISEFVHELLLARGSSALEACELRVFDFDEDDVPNVNSWIRYVVMRSVQVLWLNFYRHSNHIDPWFHLDDLPLVSQHLTRLQLSVLQLNDSFLDFSSCSVLEDLEIDYCELSSVNRISSQSLKSLSIISQCSFGYTSRTQIYVPNLISLRMEVGFGRTPVLERMPSLMEAVVKIDSCYDSCGDGDGSGDCDIEDCEVCYGIDGDADNCVVLQSLSEAKDLVLLTNAETKGLKMVPHI